MFVAVCDQDFGTSTLSWRKIVCPFSFPISAVRFSHSTESNGDTFPSVKKRRNSRPLVRWACCSACLLFNAIFVAAISASARQSCLQIFTGGGETGTPLLHYTPARSTRVIAAVGME